MNIIPKPSKQSHSPDFLMGAADMLTLFMLKTCFLNVNIIFVLKQNMPSIKHVEI